MVFFLVFLQGYGGSPRGCILLVFISLWFPTGQYQRHPSLSCRLSSRERPIITRSNQAASENHHGFGEIPRSNPTCCFCRLLSSLVVAA
ncbi:uncharacterized protein BCR38DRAFT_449765 [Pseudomassariella vexata]|uniref:Uncharacterized protein n=1 Tax=Pseudomassariella vexata TaxID=1141098 RepID=A0A1Y2DD21_9PEZI|nr:uncharacterized protein BCR38DRAFT_449765 [Pseudomassariella vexata]ORY57149.1 hypothetical protein BCR38DRAFT_449765 [Pseudomassariella vexata]